MARPTLIEQKIRNTKKQEDPKLFEFKLRICKNLHRAILRARKLPEEQRYEYLETYLQQVIETMY